MKHEGSGLGCIRGHEHSRAPSADVPGRIEPAHAVQETVVPTVNEARVERSGADQPADVVLARQPEPRGGLVDVRAAHRALRGASADAASEGTLPISVF
jgi:hypothetical protein